MQIDGNTPITLNVTVDITNAILGALSAQPYERVAGIIANIQQQATPQVAASQAPAQEAKPE